MPTRMLLMHGKHIAAIHPRETAVKRYLFSLLLLFRSPRQRHGQSIVEMAVFLPFLLLITLGIIVFGYYVYTYS